MVTYTQQPERENEGERKMRNFIVKTEFLEYWGDECTEDYVVTEEEVRYLAAEWGKTFEELLEQFEEV